MLTVLQFILTDEVRDMMTVMPGYRTPYQVAEVRVLIVSFYSFIG